MKSEEIVSRIINVIESNKSLTDFGIRQKNDEKYSKDRELLLKNKKAVFKTYLWIKEYMDPIKSYNTRHSSYGLKHIAEKQIGYITNGTFITAAIMAGHKAMPTSYKSPNVWFNMSEKKH